VIKSVETKEIPKKERRWPRSKIAASDDGGFNEERRKIEGRRRSGGESEEGGREEEDVDDCAGRVSSSFWRMRWRT